MALEIGTAYVSIIPSTRGMVREIQRSLDQDVGRTSRRAGRRMGQDISEGITEEVADTNPFEALRQQAEKSRTEITRLSATIQQTSEAERKAAHRLSVERLRLQEANERGNTSESVKLMMQEALEQAEKNYANAVAKSSAALAERDGQTEDATKREQELTHATELRARAEELAEKSRTNRAKVFNWSRQPGRRMPQLDLDLSAMADNDDRYAEFQRIITELQERHKITVEIDYDRNAFDRINRESRKLNSKPITSFFAGIGRGIQAVESIFVGFLKQIPGTWIVIGVVVAALLSAFTPLLGAVSQLVGLLAAIPATLAGVGAALATVVVGSLGVFKALGAGFSAKATGGGAGGEGNGRQLERAQKQAARAAADAAKQIAEAEKALTRAQRDALRAQEDLNEARREAADDIEELNRQLGLTHLEEEGAILGVRRAYESLRETMSDGDSTKLDRDEARLSYKESVAQLQDVRRKNGELAEEVDKANRAGVEGHDKVVDAQEGVADAAEKVKDAEQGVADAHEQARRSAEDSADSMADASSSASGGAAAVDEYAEALAGLTPNAREFVETVMLLKDAWGTVQDATQEALFEGMGPAFARFSKEYIPLLTHGLSGYAAEFSSFFTGVFDRMATPEITSVWTDFFNQSRIGLAEMLPAFHNLGEIFAKVSEIGSRAFPGIGQSIREWTERLLEFVNNNPDRILGWVEAGAESFGRLKDTTYELLRVIKNILAPNIPDGENQWDTLNETLRKWADTLGSEEGQREIREFFTGIRETFVKIGNIIDKIDQFTQGGSWLAGAMGFEPPAPEAGTDAEFGKTAAEDGKDNPWTGAWLKDKLFGKGDDDKGPGDGGGGAGGSFGDAPKTEGASYLPGDSVVEGPDDKALEVQHTDFRTTGNVELDTSHVRAGEPYVPPIEDELNKALERAKSVQDTLNGFMQPVYDTWNAGWATAETSFGTFKDNVALKWGELSTGMQSWYNTHIQPTLGRFGLDTDSLKNGNGIAANIMRGDWQGLGGNISDVIDNHIAPAMERMKVFGQGVKDKFFEIVDGIKTKWGELKAGTAVVINWVIDHVLNGGLFAAWDQAAKFLPLTKSTPMERIPGYATGGRVDGKGTSTSDSIIARLSRGEHVWDNMDVRNAGGHDAVYAIRALIGKGIPFTWDMAKGLAARGPDNIAALDSMSSFQLGRDGDLGLPGFARGGAVDLRKVEKPEEPAWVAQLARGHEYAQRVAPAPYLLGASSGGVKGGLTDCSGFMSEIADVILGGNGGQRKWATGSFPGPQAGAWAPGLSQGFSIGIGHAAGGHTAGTLSGVRGYSTVNVESGGGTGQGATYGGAAVGADDGYFTEHHHMAIGADGAFEPGAGGGPSPEEQKSMLKKLLEEVFDKVLGPLGKGIAAGFAPPPLLDEIPGGFFEEGKSALNDKLFGVVDNLGEALRTVYDKARDIKDVVSNVVTSMIGGIPFLNRDTGGILPMGASLVNNETGKPEQILNWPQIEAIQNMMRSAITLVRDLGAQHGYASDADVIANAIQSRLEQTDWEEVNFKVDAFSMNAEKVAKSAGESYVDDALGVFGFKNGRQRLQEYQDFADAISGRGAADLAGVPKPAEYINGGTGLPTVGQESVPLQTKLPDLNATIAGAGGEGKEAVKAQFAKHGWDKEPYWSAVDYIVGKESSWIIDNKNPASGAFGYFQFNPSSGTLQQYLPDRSMNASTQGAAGAKYIADRYGDPLKAKAFWEQNGWYDNGGVLRPGATLAQNDSGKDELILNNRAWHDMSTTVTQAARMAELVPAGAAASSGGGGDVINIQTMDTAEVVAAIRRRDARKAQSRIGLR